MQTVRLLGDDQPMRKRRRMRSDAEAVDGARKSNKTAEGRKLRKRNEQPPGSRSSAGFAAGNPSTLTLKASKGGSPMVVTLGTSGLDSCVLLSTSADATRP
jgi:hypothetical protein